MKTNQVLSYSPAALAAPFCAPQVVMSTGANSAFGTPAIGHLIDGRVRDAKQAAPPRGDLR